MKYRDTVLRPSMLISQKKQSAESGMREHCMLVIYPSANAVFFL